MVATEAHLKGNAKYLAKMDEIKVRVPKGKKEIYKNKAKRHGLSLNAYIVKLIEQDR